MVPRRSPHARRLGLDTGELYPVIAASQEIAITLTLILPSSGLTFPQQMILAFSAMAGFGYLVYLTKMESPASKRSYPYNGLEAELGGSAETPKASLLAF